MNRLMLSIGLCVLCPFLLSAAPLRIALLDFEDATGAKPDAALGGTINTATLAGKGVDLLAKQLLEQKDFTLIDRRDFVSKLQKATPREIAEGVPRPAFIQAAQLLGAGAVLGGSLTTFSTGKEKQTQAGFSAELTKLSLRVTVRALDAIDGSVIAVADGVQEKEVRQTDAVKTEIGEEDVLTMMEQALAKAVPKVTKALSERQASAQRERVKVNVASTDDPALVEIDGVLVGATPMEGLEVYQGDHTISISRPGYVTMTKRLVLDKNFAVKVPMLRTDLTADERKAIMEKAEIKAYITNGKPDILIQEIGN